MQGNNGRPQPVYFRDFSQAAKKEQEEGSRTERFKRPFDQQQASSPAIRDRAVILKGDNNIRRLLKRIDKRSQSFVDWHRGMDLQSLGKGYTLEEIMQMEGGRANALKRAVLGTMGKSMHNLFLRKHQQDQIFGISGPQYGREKTARPQTAIVYKGPSLCSLHSGRASYLDYKKRSNLSGSKPSNVESEQKDPETIPIPKIILKKVSLVDERKQKREKVKQELANLQFQMKSLRREKFEVEKEFISSQRRVRNNTLVTSVPQSSVNYTIHEALQMRHSKQQHSLKAESQQKQRHSGSQSLTRKNSLHKLYSYKSLVPKRATKLDPTVKQDQFKILFKTLKNKSQQMEAGEVKKKEAMTSRGEVIRSSTGLEYLFKCMQRSNQWVSRQEFNRQCQRIPTLPNNKMEPLQGSNFTGRQDYVKQGQKESLSRQIEQHPIGVNFNEETKLSDTAATIQYQIKTKEEQAKLKSSVTTKVYPNSDLIKRIRVVKKPTSKGHFIDRNIIQPMKSRGSANLDHKEKALNRSETTSTLLQS